MPTSHDRLMDVLADALDVPAGAARAAFLDRACAGDASLRADVERLLSRHREADAVFADGKLAADWVPDSALRGPGEPAADPGPDLVGTRVGPYELTAVLGRGGIGVVYRAVDTRLRRPAAVKTLPAAVAADPAQLRRFAREARLLASLSHPNVAAVYGTEETPAGRFLAMELVEGESLAARLARGPMPVGQAVRVCAQVAAGLAAAHDAGLVHRDVKPANVMLTPRGEAKVLDFGLARTDQLAAGYRGTAAGPNLTMTVTAAHEVVGTPQYMSPEQLHRQPVDRRADVFAFGCVLYECLTGTPAFDGEHPADVVSAVLEKRADLSRLPTDTPDGVRRVLERCLTKNRDYRLRDLGDARVEMLEALEALEAPEASTEEPDRPPAPAVGGRAPPHRDAGAKRAAGLMLGATAVLASFFTVMVMRSLTPKRTSPPLTPLPSFQPLSTRSFQRPQVPTAAGPVERFNVPLPPEAAGTDLPDLTLSVARDGGAVVVGSLIGGRPTTFVRRRGELAFATATEPPADGPTTLTGSTFVVPAGGRGIARVPRGGGPPVYITRPDPAAGEVAHLHPFATPDGQAVVFTVADGRGGYRSEICDVDGSNRRPLLSDAAGARVVQTPIGPHVLFVRSGDLFAAPFDAAARTAGAARRVAEGVAVDRATGRPLFDASDDGTLAYVAGRPFLPHRRLARVQPGGATSPLPVEPGPFAEPHASGDGRWVSVVVRGERSTAAVYDATTGLAVPLDLPGDVTSAAISPDGLRLAYASYLGDAHAVSVRTLADGREVRLAPAGVGPAVDLTWSSDGRAVWFAVAPTANVPNDIWKADADGAAPPRAVVTGPADERSPAPSSDGRVAYASDAGGRWDVYVRPIAGGEATRLSTTGGGRPQWSPPDGVFTFRAGGRDAATSDRAADHAVLADGGWVVLKPADGGAKASHVTVVLNWWRAVER